VKNSGRFKIQRTKFILLFYFINFIYIYVPALNYLNKLSAAEIKAPVYSSLLFQIVTLKAKENIQKKKL